jgi:hypothetical protein
MHCVSAGKLALPQRLAVFSLVAPISAESVGCDQLYGRTIVSGYKAALKLLDDSAGPRSYRLVSSGKTTNAAIEIYCAQPRDLIACAAELRPADTRLG